MTRDTDDEKTDNQDDDHDAQYSRLLPVTDARDALQAHSPAPPFIPYRQPSVEVGRQCCNGLATVWIKGWIVSGKRVSIPLFYTMHEVVEEALLILRLFLLQV
jgi:hypothetical protein